MLRHYPSYRLADFYSKSFLDGGATYKQLITLFRYADEERYDNFKFHAAIHGIDLDAPPEDETSESSDTPRVYGAGQGAEERFLFKDPADYEKMTDEQRAKEDQKMKEHWGVFRIRSSPKEQS